MLSFKHDIPTKLYFGEGQIKRLAKSLLMVAAQLKI